MPAPHRLLIATGNAGKIRELRTLLNDARWQLVTPADAGVADLEVIEDGDSFRANAAKKARAYANASRLPALADDSGLEVDALGGAPGVRSARYAGDSATDAENRAMLLAALDGLPTEERGARFRAVVALSFPYGPNVRFGEGTVEGRIAANERGDNGFGYDPIFELADGRRMAELTSDEKNAISHRGQAVRDIAWALESLTAALPHDPHTDAGGRDD
ncbi:MAG: XTP/dITP diphosphohydrolase [Chloroflexi bacterium]|nr:MAG: XTP/dITP diphosphohydrolase [Chloroflexota bacterium]